MDNCDPATDEELQQTCNNVPCVTYTWESGDLDSASCNADCGEAYGFRYVRVTCKSSTGLTVDSSYCDAAKRPRSYQLCTPPPCAGPHYNYSPWSACSRACGGGTQARTAVCHSQDGTPQVNDSLCRNSDVQREDTERACNTAKCAVFGWVILPWSECDNEDDDCDGTRTCELQCKCALPAACLSLGQCCCVLHGSLVCHVPARTRYL